MPQTIERFGRRLPERLPGTLAQTKLRLANTLSRLEKRGQFVGRELAQSFEGRMPWKRSDADKAYRFRRRKTRTCPGEELHEIQLIEKVVLEPQDQLIVRLVTSNRFSPQPQIVDRIAVGLLSRPTQISSTAVGQVATK